jgi:putative transposase
VIWRLPCSIKEEELDWMTFMGEASLRYALSQYLAHYHAECNHQGLDNELIVPDPEVSRANGQVNR